MNKHDEDEMIEAIRKDDGGYNLDGVLAKAKRKGLLSHFERKSRLRVLIPVFSAVLALAVAIPVTWSVTRQITKNEDLSSQQGGGAVTVDVIKYMEGIAQYHYDTSIGTLIDFGTIYADVYYAFDSASINYIVVALHSKNATSFEAYDGETLIKSSSSSIGSFLSQPMSLSLTFVFYDVGERKASIGFSTDLKPYFDSAK